MGVTASEVTNIIDEVDGISQMILKTIESVDPKLAVPSEAANALVILFSQLASTAINAWSNAAGVPITTDSLLALLPNPTPLTAPTE